MNAELVAAFLGALFATFLLSRLLLRLLKGRLEGASRIVVGHLASAALACAIAAYGFGRDGALNWENSGFYLAGQAVWLVADLLALRGRRAGRR